MKVKVTVFHVASKQIEDEVPDSVLQKLPAPGRDCMSEVRDFVQASLNQHLPEVHEGSCFEFPTGFQLEGDDFETDLEG